MLLNQIEIVRVLQGQPPPYLCDLTSFLSPSCAPLSGISLPQGLYTAFVSAWNVFPAMFWWLPLALHISATLSPSLLQRALLVTLYKIK